MTKPDVLLGSVSRCDGGEIRVYRKLFKGRPYIELSTWSPETEGGQCIRAINVRRYELRPLLRALLQACKALGVSPRAEEKDLTELAVSNSSEAPT